MAYKCQRWPVLFLLLPVFLLLWEPPAGAGGRKSARRMRTNEFGMAFVKIPEGSFVMGSPVSEDGRQKDEVLHKVVIARAFYLQKTEVTQGHWDAVMGSNPSMDSACGESCPVTVISWDDIQQFIFRLNALSGGQSYRLPTEAEWEYACRAGSRTAFAFGRCLSYQSANYDARYPLSLCFKGEYRAGILPVASFAPNAWGLHDMHGNVLEWCQDRYGPYPETPESDTGGETSGGERVIRGGSCVDTAARSRSAFRAHSSPDLKSAYLGFRLVLTP